MLCIAPLCLCRLTQKPPNYLEYIGAQRRFNWKEKRTKLLGEYTIKNGDHLELESDKTFSSPSTAADFCIGSSNNGWIVWKDKDGQTLDEVYRKQLDK